MDKAEETAESSTEEPQVKRRTKKAAAKPPAPVKPPDRLSALYDPSPGEPGEKRKIRRVASQEWLDPFSGQFISADLRTSPISGAKRIDRFTAQLPKKVS